VYTIHAYSVYILTLYSLRYSRGCHTSIGHKCIKYKGCKLCNNLPMDLKSITSNKLFNNKLKIFLRSSSD